ncbi:STAS domain-containing protein [Methylosinus sp. Sm6]|uniref:STAS domain-containing protein n=1 Tax=Methylosinus sp. Sm6 TaxID=2866948 RepID=UPI001C9912F4|nr:STAS domain-containing protein [Methylosinus sp. Sm6]MBY6240578.1 STAS domain-containing protein [Methylosinus sp. Sm6]
MITMRLAEILDIRAASPLAGELLNARGGHVTVDASNVQKLGAQCVQVLLSARSTWAADGYSLVVADASEPFLAALATLGIQISDISEQDTEK